MNIYAGAGEIIGNDRLIEDIEGDLERRRSPSGSKSNHSERAVAYRRFARKSRPPMPNNLGAVMSSVVEPPQAWQEIAHDPQSALRDRSKIQVHSAAIELFGETSQIAA